MAASLKNWQNLPDFTLANVESSTIHPSADEGYDIQAAKISDFRRKEALEYANGILSGLGSKPSDGFRVRFFCTEFQIDIGLSGTYGQGRRVRDFYPHNFKMPTFKITGQVLDQRDYAHLIEFIHESHQYAMYKGEPVQFDLLSGGLPIDSKREIGNGQMKGPHQAVIAQGFIESVAREHKQFAYVPTFSFNMAVVRSYKNGVFQETLEPAQKTFFERLEEQEKTPFSQAPKGKGETGKGSTPTSTPGPQPEKFEAGIPKLQFTEKP